MPFIHNERKGSWVASTECLSVLSIIKEGIRTPGPTVHVCLALHRVHFDGKFINPYRHVLFSPWSQNPSCGTRPHQKPTDHLQSFGVRIPDFWCFNTDRPWDPWLSADEWPQSQHSVHWPLLSWLAVHADSEHPPRTSDTRDEFYPTTILVLWATGLPLDSPLELTQRSWLVYFFPL